MTVTTRDVLLVIDVQNDFCPGGALPVANGNAVVAPILRAATRFSHVILTQDWHPPGHHSFASAYPGKQPFDTIETNHGPQVLWPEHCVQGTPGAELVDTLSLPQAELILRKGFRREIDSYSAFVENDQVTGTGLAGYLRERGLDRVFCVGLAYDFCVGFSALDAVRMGFPAIVLRSACRSIDTNGSVHSIEQRFQSAGVTVVESLEA